MHFSHYVHNASRLFSRVCKQSVHLQSQPYPLQKCALSYLHQSGAQASARSLQETLAGKGGETALYTPHQGKRKRQEGQEAIATTTTA